MNPLIFGVRHLSPAGAHHLLKLLNEIQPRCVLIEGPSDCTPLITQIAGDGINPPIAMLAYTTDIPVASICIPLASYSPEYQAALWAMQHHVECYFIDLPTDISLAIRDGENGNDQEEVIGRQNNWHYQNSLYDDLAHLGGWDNHDSYWEATFEHNPVPGAYLKGVREFSAQMRQLTEPTEKELCPLAYQYNALREAHMKREINRVLNSYNPEEILIVCGAYHVTGLESDTPGLSDDGLAALPRRETRMTLMPYSYFRLSSQSGYGAGNHAPAYFDQMWQLYQNGDVDSLPAIYLSTLGGFLRDKGVGISTASVIESVRLANALASLKSLPRPILADLHEAAVSCLGHGHLSEIAEGLALADVGTAIGSLPEGVSQTPVQDDFNRQLKTLKLEKYKSTVAQDLELDLRENRRVQSESAAFLDLHRSTMLHRLHFLGIPFAEYVSVNQQNATWYEKWVLRWTPEAEIALVETTLLGETIEVAVSYRLKEQLESCQDVLSAAALIGIACECQLPESLQDSLKALQMLATDAANILKIAESAQKLSALVQYGDLRRYDAKPLIPLLGQLFLRSCLLLQDSATCDDKAANDVLQAINLLHIISQEHFDDVNDELWLKELQVLAFRDDRNARLSGAAFAVLLERGEIAEERYSAEVSRRLSPGIPVDIGAGWFEGLAGRNHYALLSRTNLWRELDAYIAELDEEDFIRSMVFLRRAFSTFDSREKNSAAELLGQLWGLDQRQVAELLQGEINQEEQTSLDALNDFDFGDL